MRRSISRTAVRYSSSFRRSVAPRPPFRRSVSSRTKSRMLLLYRCRLARVSGVSFVSPNKRSKTARGLPSGGIAVDVVRQEILLLQTQPLLTYDVHADAA